MTPAQLAYWDALLERLSRMDEWKKKDENDLWENNYMGSKDARRYLDTQYEELHRVLSGLGIAKK
jgi:tripartite-type tricarboxylate transporter receptor subunit TctC